MLAAQVWGSHPLGRPILGTLETLERIGSPALKSYFGSRYRPEHLIVAAAGALEHERVCDLVASSFATPEGEALPLSGDPPAFRPSVRHEVQAGLQQLYLSLGTRATAYSDPVRHALIVLNTL